MWTGPRNPVNSHSAWLYMNLSQGKMPFPGHFFCTWRSASLKPQLDTSSTASSMNGCVLKWRIDSSTSLCQNSWNSVFSVRALSWINKNGIITHLKGGKLLLDNSLSLHVYQQAQLNTGIIYVRHVLMLWQQLVSMNLLLIKRNPNAFYHKTSKEWLKKHFRLYNKFPFTYEKLQAKCPSKLGSR